ncbi:MAG: hypothetical protein A2201_07435 [Alicyclobacillus sp. RIFOXYA1_FULL_53_8]|nr:MAG: hypothetical protein A2201_07435 [Alicyclobacillus sp. RIFOXYA1_FULL_53_8]
MTKTGRTNFFAVLIIIVVALVTAYCYAFFIQKGGRPFIITASTTPAESDAASLLGTNQTDNIQLVNVSDWAVRLWSVKFVDYKGMTISHLTVDGEPIHGQEVPSNHGDGKLVTIKFNVHIDSSTIQNPQTVSMVYSYWGLKHTQSLNLFPLR